MGAAEELGALGLGFASGKRRSANARLAVTPSVRPPVWHWLHRGVLDKPQSPAHEEEGSHSVCVCGGGASPQPPIHFIFRSRDF